MRCARLISVWLFCAGLGAQESLKQSYEAAQQLFLKGEDARASAAFYALLAATLRERAVLYRRQSSWPRVRDDLVAALEIEPGSVEARYELAFAQFRLGIWSEAAPRLEQLAREQPGEARFHGLLGRVYLSAGRPAAAREELGAALRLQPDDALTDYTLALAALAQKDIEAAQSVFASLEKSQHSSPRFHLLVGRAYLDAGYQPEAQREFGEALRIDPKIRFARYLLALSYLREQEMAAIPQAATELARELDLFPDEFAARYLLGLLFETGRQWVRAAEELQKAVRLSLSEPDPYFHLGAVYLKLGRASDAAEALRRALELSPKGSPSRFRVSRAHYLLSQAYKALGDPEAGAREAEAARQASRAATRQDQKLLEDSPLHAELDALTVPGMQVSWQEMTPSVPPTEEQKELLSVCSDVLANAHNYLGLIAGRERRFTDAARQFALVWSMRRDFPEIDFNLGLALFQAEKYDEALEPLDRAMGTSSNPATAKILGLACFHVKRYERAVELLDKVRAADAGDPQVLIALGTSLARLGRVDDAQRVFVDLLKSQPDSAPLHVLWGEAYAGQNQPQEAGKEFRRALELDPRAASAHFDLGMLSLKRGAMDQAESEFRAELDAHPDDVRARYHLAFILLSRQKPEDAVPLLRQVIAAKPGYAEAHYSLGKALLQQGAVVPAIEQLEAAIRLDASKPYMHYQLGRAYMQAGKREEAQREFQLSQRAKKQ